VSEQVRKQNEREALGLRKNVAELGDLPKGSKSGQVRRIGPNGSVLGFLAFTVAS
jgi:hypothetical protein